MGDVWSEARRDFPALERYVYLNAASGSPTPRVVREAVTACYREMEEKGEAGWSAWNARRDEVRAHIARFVGAAPDEIAFMPNTSAGMNLAVDLVAGDGAVLTDELEFPTVTLPWIHRGAEVHFLSAEDGIVHPEAFDVARAPQAATIAVSQVQFSNGCRMDIQGIGTRKAGRHLVVSGSQGMGVFPLDVKACAIDVLATTGHKWLCAGHGTGFVYISRALLERVPHAIGWLSVERPFRFDNGTYSLLPSAARYELGCPSFPSIIALGAALDYLDGLGAEAIARRVLAVNTLLTDRLQAAGFRVLSPLGAQRSGETLVAVANPSRAQAFLEERRVLVTRKPEGLRISTHFYNDESDIEACISALVDYTRQAEA